MMKTNLPALSEVLDEIEFFERERTDRQFVELAILLYDFGVSLRKVERVLGWIGVERSDVAIWNWIQNSADSWEGRLAAGRRPAGGCSDRRDSGHTARQGVHAVRGGRSRDAPSAARGGYTIEGLSHDAVVPRRDR